MLRWAEGRFIVTGEKDVVDVEVDVEDVVDVVVDVEVDGENNDEDEEEESDDYNPVLYKGILGAPALLSIVQFHQGGTGDH